MRLRRTSAVQVSCCGHAPGGVEQEVWGFLLVHWAIRDLMHAAALDAEMDADGVSFTRAFRLARRTVTEQAAFSP